MNINDLNKNQIILLTLLVSFVTSIATGIVTVTLLDQAPAGVTQTINQVVERTIERVVPDDTKVSTVIKEVPVIVTEEDLIVKVINNTAPSVVKISEFGGNSTNILGTGFFVSKEGLVVTHLSVVSEKLPYYGITLENGKKIKAELISRDESVGIAFLSVSLEEIKIKDENQVEKNIAPLLLSKDPLSVGQTVIAFGSSEPNTSSTVSVGIIAGLYKDSSGGLSSIKTNASTQANVGGPLINIKGEVVGMNGSAGNAVSFRVISALVDALGK